MLPTIFTIHCLQFRLHNGIYANGYYANITYVIIILNISNGSYWIGVLKTKSFYSKAASVGLI